jgi:CRP-like cAMP-binding protein
MECAHHSLLHSIFSKIVSFSQTEWDKGLPAFSFHTYAPKECVFSCGDKPKDVHFVITGIGRYFYIDKEGKERNKSLVRSGGAFASLSTVIEESPSPFFAQAITQCTVATIKYDALVVLSESNAQWGAFLRKILERLVLKKEKREASFLLMSAKERYEHFLNEFKEDSQFIPLRQVAMYIGITDVALSRIRREMGLT